MKLMVKGARTIHTIDEGEVNARHPEMRRRAAHQPFPDLGTLVESTGKHRLDRIDLTGRNAVDARGRAGILREWGVPMAGSSARVRRLDPADEEAIRMKDEETERALEVVGALRGDREVLVKAAWRKANHTITGGDLENLALETTRRDLEARSEKARA